MERMAIRDPAGRQSLDAVDAARRESISKTVYRQCNSDPIAELKSDSRDIGFLSLRKAKGEPDGGSGGGVGDPGRDYIIHDDTLTSINRSRGDDIQKRT
jgi:hypothetical protein